MGEAWSWTREALLAGGLIAALIAAYVGGLWSDKLGGRRKIFVYIAGAVMSAVCIISMFNRSMVLLFFLCALFGAAFGLFGSVDFALVCDVLPNQADRAKDMALWHISLVLPQFLATPVAGGVLDGVNSSSGPDAAYGAVFAIAFLYFVLVGCNIIIFYLFLD